MKGGCVSPCTVCGDWGLFCQSCWVPYSEGSCSLTVTRCPKQKPVYDPNVDGLGYYSPSQIESYRTCNRKWAWRYIERVQAPPNPFAAFGLEVHAQIEAYLIHGTQFNLMTAAGECAMAGLHYLPKPGAPGMTVEQPWYMTGWGHLFHGKKDIQIDRRQGTDWDPQDREIPLVIDHKTKGALTGPWVPTPESLTTDPQAVLYAADAMVKFKAMAVDLRWIIYKRNPPFKARPVEVRVYRETLEPALTDIIQTVDEMALVKASGKRALELAPNPSACGAYGGCPYVRHCNLSPREALIGIMSQPGQPGPELKSTFLDDMRRKAGLTGAGAAVNPPPMGAVPQGPPQNWGQPPSGPPPQGQPQAPPANPYQAPSPSQPQVDETVLAQARQYTGPNWNPGDAFPVNGQWVYPGQPGYPPVFVFRGDTAPPQGQPQNGAPMPPAEGAADQGGDAEQKKGKGGRPKGSKNKATAAADIDPNANPIQIAIDGLDMVLTGFQYLKTALIRITGYNPEA